MKEALQAITEYLGISLVIATIAAAVLGLLWMFHCMYYRCEQQQIDAAKNGVVYQAWTRNGGSYGWTKKE